MRSVLRAGNGAGICERPFSSTSSSLIHHRALPVLFLRSSGPPGLTWVIAIASQILSLLCPHSSQPRLQKMQPDSFSKCPSYLVPLSLSNLPASRPEDSTHHRLGAQHNVASPVQVPQGECAREEGSWAKP